MNIDKIYIPTLGRVNNQRTYESLPDFVAMMTYLVIQPQELTDIKKNYPNANLVVLPEEVKGIAKTREYIVGLGNDTLYGMLDDDLEFARRNVDRTTNKKTGDKAQTDMTEQDWKDWFDKVENWLNNDYGACGMRFHAFPPNEKEDIEFQKISQVYFINGNKFSPNEIKWDIQFSEDIYFILQLLELGNKTIVSDKYLYRHPDGHFSEGGCSDEGRNEENDYKTLLEVSKRYPQLFNIDTINGKYQVNWKKAYRQVEYNEFDKWK